MFILKGCDFRRENGWKLRKNAPNCRENSRTRFGFFDCLCFSRCVYAVWIPRRACVKARCVCQNREGITQGRGFEGAYRGFSKGNCDARFREMAIGRVRVFQRSYERYVSLAWILHRMPRYFHFQGSVAIPRSENFYELWGKANSWKLPFPTLLFVEGSVSSRLRMDSRFGVNWEQKNGMSRISDVCLTLVILSISAHLVLSTV